MEWPTLEPLTSEHDISILHASTTTSTLTLTLLVSLQKFLRRRTSQQSPMWYCGGRKASRAMKSKFYLSIIHFFNRFKSFIFNCVNLIVLLNVKKKTISNFVILNGLFIFDYEYFATIPLSFFINKQITVEPAHRNKSLTEWILQIFTHRHDFSKLYYQPQTHTDTLPFRNSALPPSLPPGSTRSTSSCEPEYRPTRARSCPTRTPPSRTRPPKPPPATTILYKGLPRWRTTGR